MPTTPLLGSYGDISASGLMFRNKLINGDMRIFQRGAGSFTVTAGTPLYGTDRWFAQSAGGNPAIGTTATTAPPGFKYSSFINGASGVTDSNLNQRIESLNCFDLTNSSVMVFSGWFFSTTSWTPSLSIIAANAVDNYSTSTTIINDVSLGNVAANTWTKLTYTFTLATGTPSNGIQLQIKTGAITSGVNRLITGIQLETGPVATPFEYRPIGTELGLCQRYYQAFQSIPCIPIPGSSNTFSLFIKFNTPMRIGTNAIMTVNLTDANYSTSPSGNQWATGNGGVAYQPKTGTIAWNGFDFVTTTEAFLTFTGATFGANAITLRALGTSGIFANAEL